MNVTYQQECLDEEFPKSIKRHIPFGKTFSSNVVRVVNLKEHIGQFDAYMNQADKPVPVFFVIGPDFTEDSEVEVVRYQAQHFDRNIVLITAGELKSLANEWSSEANKRREDAFNLGLLAATGRFKRERLGKIV